MGEEVDRVEFTRADRTAFRDQVHRNLDAFARMLREDRFAPDRPMTGIEIELNLVDEHCDPAFKNSEVLSAIEDDAFQTELGQFNIEINVPPGQIDGIGLDTMEANIRDSLNAAEEKASRTGSSMVVVGILPTLLTEHIRREALSTNPRYALLNDQIFAARGEDVQISIDGVERLQVTADSIVPEAACTSTQFHLQVTPEAFPRYWNAAQAISGVQLAIGAQLAVPVRQGVVAGDADRVVRAGRRHPHARAEDPGRAAAGLVRRTLDHVDLRSLRGELAVLPGAVAGDVGRGSDRRARSR